MLKKEGQTIEGRKVVKDINQQCKHGKNKIVPVLN
jgi:hypothetical protein